MATVAEGARRIPAWAAWLAPAAVVAALLVLFTVWDPARSLQAPPPVEELAVERTVLREGVVELSIRNDGPDPVTIAQVLVDDSYWAFEAESTTLGRLEGTTVRIDYPWEEGLPLAVTFVTSTGVTVEHEIEAAAATPEVGAAVLWLFVLLGLYVGVIPVAAGLLWWPALRRVSERWMGFWLAFTVGLLVFLLVDTVAEGLELAGEAGAALDGVGIFALGALATVAGLAALSEGLSRRARDAATGSLVLAYLVAVGIGLHNLGEGIAVGAALAAGEAALGAALVVGFAMHNTTEGLAILAPFGRVRARPRIGHFVALGAIAGVPTIAGAVAGGFAFSPAPAAFAFGVAAGAIAQVTWAVGRRLTGDAAPSQTLVWTGFAAGLVVLYATGLLVA